MHFRQGFRISRDFTELYRYGASAVAEAENDKGQKDGNRQTENHPACRSVRLARSAVMAFARAQFWAAMASVSRWISRSTLADS